MTKILVLGGTGLLGRPVVHRLHADGFQVRLLARAPERASEVLGQPFEIVAGDVTDVESLGSAIKGCDGVHISVGGAVDQLSAENVARLAPDLDIERITYVSGSTVFPQNSWFPMVAQKLAAENAIRGCGVPYTIFCPTWPMEQLPRFVRGGGASIIADQPTTFSWFTADDLAHMVSVSYQRGEAANKRFFVHGPEKLSMEAALTRYCSVLHPEITDISIMPIETARSVAVSTNNPVLGFFAELMAYFEQVGELGDPAEANQILGAPGTTLDAWIEQRTARSVS
jgi:uncharacterized protein YbjT (DUF2867 family)